MNCFPMILPQLHSVENGLYFYACFEKVSTFGVKYLQNEQNY